MVGIGARRVANAKIIDDQTEDNVFGVVTPEAGRERRWAVAVRREKRIELVVGEAASLGKTVHPAANLDEYVTVVEQRPQIVLVDDGFGQHIYGNAHILVS